MPALPISKKTKVAAAAAAMMAALIVAGKFADDYTHETAVILEDAGLSRTQGAKRMTDLLSEDIEPGAVGQTSVNLPPGSRVDDVTLTGGFAVIDQNHQDSLDATLYILHARNNGAAKARIMGFITYDVPSADAGVADAP